jgi:predicted permease
MDNLLFSINVVLPMFLQMCLGTLLTKLKIFDETFLKKANRFAFQVLFPILMFNNIYKSSIQESFNVKLVAFAVITVFTIIGLSFLMVPKFEKSNKNRGVLIQAIYRSNFVLFGVPLCTNIFGESSLGVTSTLIAIIVPIYNFMAVLVLDIYSKDKTEIKKVIISICKNPMIIGSVAAIIVCLLGIRLPSAIDKTISDISKIATPLALMILGGEFRIGNVYKNLKYIVPVSLIKLVVSPAIVLTIAVMMGFRGPELGVLFAMITAPVAVSSFTMAQQYDSNHELAGQIVFVTTFLCSFTIFIFIYILKTIGIF